MPLGSSLLSLNVTSDEGNRTINGALVISMTIINEDFINGGVTLILKTRHSALCEVLNKWFFSVEHFAKCIAQLPVRVLSVSFV